MTGRQLASLISVLSAMALVVLDAGMLNVALPTIGTSLKVTPAEAILAISAYQTALVIALLPCAHLAERLGYRRLFVGGLALFSAASILCAFAPSLPLLVVARCLQGLGGAAIMALGIALLRFALGAERLGAAIGWNAMTVGLCSAAGPIAGAAILAFAPWPWLFLSKLPICVVALGAAAALPEVEPTRKPIDGPGMALHGSTAALVLVAAETVVGRPLAGALLIAAAFASGAILIRRQRSRSEPIWPMDLLALRPLRASVAASIFCFSGQSAGLLALAFHMHLARGHEPVSIGLVLACWPLTVAATGPVAAWLSQRFGSALLCALGGVALAAGLLLIAIWPAGDRIAPLAAGAALAGLGFGLFQVPNNRTMFLSAPPERSAAAGGLQGSARVIGQTLGAMVIGLLFAYAPPIVAAQVGLVLASLFAIASGSISAWQLPALSRYRPSSQGAAEPVIVSGWRAAG